VARCTVERLMKAEGLRGIRREKGRRTTIADGAETERPAGLVERQFVATATNQLWVADLTYVRTHSGWVYAAFILDVFSRMVVGWQVSTSLRTDLALDALDMGLWARQRAGQDVAGLTHHSDRGVNIEPSATPSGSPKPRPSPRSDPRATAMTRACRERLRDPGVRAVRPAARRPVQLPRRGQARRVRLPRGVLQPRRRHSSLGQISPGDVRGTTRRKPCGMTMSAETRCPRKRVNSTLAIVTLV